ncbi:MAG: hypothetical protein C4547_01135 [Phycisphaerales bacterium]|nr:MAG: hypothetical protein C4547_01135 [Phycisphaerales bacterium]
MVVLVTFFTRAVTPAFADPVIKLQNWRGTIDYAPEGLSSFTLEGTASHLGRFSAHGEITLLPGQEQGSLEGEGIVVFEAANGDLLVGVTTWQADADEIGQMSFSWRDSVEFSDGAVVSSTGRFAEAEDRPRGLVVIAIIAVLIGLLVPAIQK